MVNYGKRYDMKDKKTGLRKEIILITSIALLIISVTSSGTKLYFSIPSALVCFLCETYGLANRTQNKTYKFIFSVFSPFCFLFLHFWLLYLCQDPSTMMKRAHSSLYIRNSSLYRRQLPVRIHNHIRFVHHFHR